MVLIALVVEVARELDGCTGTGYPFFDRFFNLEDKRW
jgi:hypothetical protein